MKKFYQKKKKKAVYERIKICVKNLYILLTE